MHCSRIAVFVAAVVATPAYAQDIPALTLTPGQAVTVRFDDGGRVGAPERGRAEWSRFDLYAARQLAGETPPDAPLGESTPINAPEGISPDPIPPGEVRLRFFGFNGHGLLVVENGRGGALRYRARMTVSGQERHTDVCVVLPHLPSYEHWPHSVERLELTDFEFIAWTPGRNPTCE
jgi:hypothetical protein